MEENIDYEQKQLWHEDWIRQHFKDWSEKDLLIKVHSIYLEMAENDRNWKPDRSGWSNYVIDGNLAEELLEHTDALRLLHGYQNVLTPEFTAKAKETYLEEFSKQQKDKDRDDLDLEME